jgi:hypothetical protein
LFQVDSQYGVVSVVMLTYFLDYWRSYYIYIYLSIYRDLSNSYLLVIFVFIRAISNSRCE